MTKRKALGRGVKSLFSTDLTDEPPPIPRSRKQQDAAKKELNQVPSEGSFTAETRNLSPNAYQPRKLFNDHDLEELAQSIREVGIIQPIIVKQQKNKAESFMIIAGERRWRAAQRAGLKEVPIIIKDYTDSETLEVALIENIQRQDLNVIEEAEAYRELQKNYGLNQDQIAKKVGKERSTVANTLRILKLPSEIQRDLTTETLSMGHARALLALPKTEDMLTIRGLVITKQLNVRQTERLIREYKAEKDRPRAQKTAEKNANITHISDNLQKHFGTKVRIQNKGSRGKIEISYTSFDDLERILSLMKD